MIPVLLGVSLIVFLMVRAIPGDPAQILLGQQATEERVTEMRAEMGLDQPIPVQYVRYLGQALQGDLGVSITTGRPVTTELLDKFPATLELTLAAMVFAIAVGVPVGVLAAVKQYSLIDRITSVFALTGISMPIFWLALILVVIFSVNLDILPFQGRTEVPIVSITGMVIPDSIMTLNFAGLWSGIQHLILPSIALGTIPMAVITRMTRSSMLEVMGEDYIRTAQAKGVVPWRVVFRHALRNALLPTVTVIGLQFGILLGGAVITETIFGWNGIGQFAIESIARRDYAAIQAVVLYGTFFFMLVNLIVDVLYAALDPRVRL